MKTPITKLDCKLKTEQCYKFNIAPMLEKMEKLEDKVDKISIQLACLPEDLMDKMDKRYAGKLTEKIVYSMIGLVAAGFILALWELLKK